METFEGMVNSFPGFKNILLVIGLIFFIKKAFKIIKVIYKNLLRHRHDLAKRYGRKSWALVTGSSDGNSILI
jgi:hypothetical protein